MSIYKSPNTNVDTFANYDPAGGVYGKVGIIKAGSQIEAKDLGSVLQITSGPENGHYVREIGFTLMSAPPTPAPVSVPVQMDITLTKGSVIVVKDSLGKTVFSYTAP